MSKGASAVMPNNEHNVPVFRFRNGVPGIYSLRLAESAEHSPLLTLGVLAALLLIFSAFSNNFFTVRGMRNLLVQTSTFTIIAIGSTLVLIVGGIDFSLEAAVTFGGTGVIFIAATIGAPVWMCMIGGFGCRRSSPR
jgi:ribose/xylose/arabinose/galactoside ABC-type transport system permease subunit